MIKKDIERRLKSAQKRQMESRKRWMVWKEQYDILFITWLIF